MNNDYSYWRSAMAGEQPAVDVNSPQPGFYSTKQRDGSRAPVAIYYNKDGALVCRVADAMADPFEVWQWAAGNPVSKEAAKHAFEAGSWPGDVPDAMPQAGHNNPPGELSVSDAIEDVATTALEWLEKHGIKDETSSNMAANYRSQLLDLGKQADAARVDEKKPLDEAAKKVQAKWKPVIDRAKEAAEALRGALTTYLREAEAQARAEAEKRAAEERAEAERSGVDASPPPPQPAPKVRAGGQRGKKTSLRTVKKCVITDRAACLEHFKGHSAITSVLERLAVDAMRSGKLAPGTELKEEQVAA
jgi:hypothetical protein